MKLLLSALLLALSCPLSVLAAPVAPPFTLKDQNNRPVSLTDFMGKVVVLEWTNPDCPFVKRHYREGTMKTLAHEFSAKGVVWLSINSSHFWNDDRAQSWAKEQSLSYPILNDNSGAVGKSYGAKTTPHMFILAKDGSIAYQGAIDDDASGDSAVRKNYVRLALDELVSGKPVSVTETKSYGCSVKYQ